MDFEGRVAIVTGGASGMGAATARRLAAGGAHVLVVDRNGDLAAAVASEIVGTPFVGDIADSGVCNDAVATVVGRHGRLDVVVNAAGVIVRASGEHTTDQQWAHIGCQRQWHVLHAAAIPVMKSQGAARSSTSVPSGATSGRQVSLRTASKTVHTDASVAMDHATDGIRVNAVCPGEVNTPMLQSERSESVTDQLLAQIAATVPMGRLADPDEIARVVCFLASDEASYMTGAMVSVDAGYGAR